jgi:hypothetical protein
MCKWHHRLYIPVRLTLSGKLLDTTSQMHVSSTQNKPLIAMPTNAMSDHHPVQLAAIVKYHTVSRNQPARQGMLKSLMRQCSSPAPKFPCSGLMPWISLSLQKSCRFSLHENHFHSSPQMS